MSLSNLLANKEAEQPEVIIGSLGKISLMAESAGRLAMRRTARRHRGFGKKARAHCPGWYSNGPLETRFVLSRSDYSPAGGGVWAVLLGSAGGLM